MKDGSNGTISVKLEDGPEMLVKTNMFTGSPKNNEAITVYEWNNNTEYVLLKIDLVRFWIIVFFQLMLVLASCIAWAKPAIVNSWDDGNLPP